MVGVPCQKIANEGTLPHGGRDFKLWRKMFLARLFGVTQEGRHDYGNLTHWSEYPPYKRVAGGSIPSVSTNPFLTDSDTLGVPPTRKGGLFGNIVQSGRSVAC